jgi:MarR family transcriptional regulator, 2-MHQ and catechol-resistance regulon repressor
MQDLELTALAEEMWVITRDLFKFLQCRDRDAMTACGLSVAQCYSLEAIGTQRRLTLNELADSLYITPSTASRTIEELVRKKLVERRQDPDDRRAVSLTLTPQGETLFEALRQHLIERQLGILEQIDPGSRRDVLTALQKLSQAVKDPACCAVPLVWTPPPTGDQANPAEGVSVRPSRPSRGARQHTSPTQDV